MKIIDLVQGTPEWLAYRSTHDNASDAPAMMGVSPYKTRGDLLREVATGVAAPVDDATQRRFDDGHRCEALARPLAEKIVGEDLYPVIVENDRQSASLDGATLDGSDIFEHKRLSSRLRVAMFDGCTGADLHIDYRVQMEQQLHCSGAKRCLFMASEWDRDGNLVEERHCWYEPDLTLRAQILAGWDQFHADLAAYTAPERTAPAVAAPVESLPAVSVQVSGALVVASNLAPFGEALRAFVAKIPKAPSSDQEFADAESACKSLKRAEDALEAAESGALASMSDVETMRRMVADFRSIARTARLAAEKAVKARKEEIRETEVKRAVHAVQGFAATCNADLGGQHITPPPPHAFAEAIKGLKTIDSLRNAIDTAVAREKIAMTQTRDRVAANLATISQAYMPALFADRATLVHKDPEAVAAIVSLRVAEHRDAEERRLEADRERIRAEERARAEADAAITRAAAPVIAPAQAAAVAAEPAQGVLVAEAPTDAPTLKLGHINERLGFTVTEAFLASIGVPCAGHDKRAVLFRESQWPVIKAKLIERIRGLA